jgi:hypothetical protein
MDVFIMYVLMIVDLTWTLLHHKQAGELNPIFSRLLSTNEVGFVYLKLLANTSAAIAVIYLEKLKPILGHILAIFGIIVYGVVVMLHWFVDYSYAHVDQVQNSLLYTIMRGH